MTLSFRKMHGLGNDFVIFDGRSALIPRSEGFIRKLSDRQFGVGCDQVIILEPPKSPKAFLSMDMFNRDGSPLRACGNASRCVGRLIFEETDLRDTYIETVAGLIRIQKEAKDLFAVAFNPPGLLWNEIPLAKAMDTLSVDLDPSFPYKATCVNMGNPHAVFFVPDVEAVPLTTLGPRFETHHLFPDRCNIEFVQILDRHTVRMRVWERGTGITKACGSGAAATLVAAVRRNLTERRAVVKLDGGDLTIDWHQDGHVAMVGSASYVYDGIITDEFLRDAV